MSLTIYIFGGERKTYLPLQLKSIKEFIPHEEIVYLQGPFHRSPALASQFEFQSVEEYGIDTIQISTTAVSPDSYKSRIRNTPPAVLPQCETEYALFLHGDIFPYDDFDVKEVLNGKQRACAQSMSMQWYLTPPQLQDDFFSAYRNQLDTFQTYSVSEVSRHEWETVFNEEGEEPIPYFSTQRYLPCFYHLNDYNRDFESVVNLKLKALSRLLG